MKIAGYQYQSCFGTFIEEFIREKKDAGFVYESEEWQLKHFDAFCGDEGITEPCLNKNLVEKWGAIREGESPLLKAGFCHPPAEFIHNISGYRSLHSLPLLQKSKKGCAYPAG